MSEDNYQGEFNVCQFFIDGTYEYVRRYVSAEAAVNAFKHYTNNVATKIGVVDRVIITDGDDCTNLEWRRGKGFTYDGVTFRDTPHSSAHQDAIAKQEQQND